MTFPIAGAFEVPATPGDFLAEDGAETLEDFLAATKQLPGAVAATELTVSAGVIVPTAATHTVDTEADAASDDLSNIQATNMPDGAVLILWPENTGRVVTLKHEAGGTGQISLTAEEDLELSVPVALQLRGSVWKELFHGQAAGEHDTINAAISIMTAWVVRMAGGSAANSYTGAFAAGVAGYDYTLKVSETAPVSMRVGVATGLWTVAGVLYQLSAAATSGLMTAPLTNPRVDKVSIDASAAIVITTGVEAASPSTPATPAGNLAIATIYHRVGETSIKNTDDSSNGYITDVRTWINK